MKEVVAGIDIGGTNTVFGLVDKAGNILAENNLKTAAFPRIEDFVTNLTAAIAKLKEGQANLKLTGIGVGAPNANYH